MSRRTSALIALAAVAALASLVIAAVVFMWLWLPALFAAL